MLNYPVLIINKSQVKISSWSKEGHHAHLLTAVHELKAKHVHEA